MSDAERLPKRVRASVEDGLDGTHEVVSVDVDDQGDHDGQTQATVVLDVAVEDTPPLVGDCVESPPIFVVHTGDGRSDTWHARRSCGYYQRASDTEVCDGNDPMPEASECSSCTGGDTLGDDESFTALEADAPLDYQDADDLERAYAAATNIKEAASLFEPTYATVYKHMVDHDIHTPAAVSGSKDTDDGDADEESDDEGEPPSAPLEPAPAPAADTPTDSLKPGTDLGSTTAENYYGHKGIPLSEEVLAYLDNPATVSVVREDADDELAVVAGHHEDAAYTYDLTVQETPHVGLRAAAGVGVTPGVTVEFTVSREVEDGVSMRRTAETTPNVLLEEGH